MICIYEMYSVLLRVLCTEMYNRIENNSCQYARYWLTKVEDTTATTSAVGAADIKQGSW